jgi:hypothetical protein
MIPCLLPTVALTLLLKISVECIGGPACELISPSMFAVANRVSVTSPRRMHRMDVYNLCPSHNPPSTLSLDFITGLPKIGTHDSILVVVCRLTKYCMLFPCSSTLTAVQLAKIFSDRIVPHFGWPRSLVSDRDKLFTSAFWSSLHTLWGCDLAMSTAYHPQTDGQTERTNRVLEETLRHFVCMRQKDWSSFLPMAQFAMNGSWKTRRSNNPLKCTRRKSERSIKNWGSWRRNPCH